LQFAGRIDHVTKTGITGEEIMFSSNDTPGEDFQLAKKLKAIINLDDIGHIAYLENAPGCLL